MKYLGPISDPKDMVNKEYVDNNASGHEELTQSQYDQLSQAEKMNGTVYFITDGEPDYTIINDSVPIGAVQAYAGAAVPYGWLFCDGSAVSRTTYSDLFAVIGTTYGSGDGSTTFNVPDFRGRVITGVGTCDGVTYALGDKKSAGVPNITGHVDIKGHTGSAEYYAQNSVANPSGAFRAGTSHSPAGYQSAQLYSQFSAPSLDFNASKSDSHYGASSTVQPNTTVANYIIKALNTVSSSALEELDPQSIIFDLFYPVGSYYETSDSTFNPNVQWRGTWIQDSKGRVLVAHDPDQTEFDTAGETGGEKTHTLNKNELPNIHGEVSLGWGDSSAAGIMLRQVSGVFSASMGTAYYVNASNSGSYYNNLKLDFGNDQAHNNLQPYTVAYRWHRTA